MKDIFRLVGNAELEAAERRYLPEKAAAKAIVLGASRGDLGEITREQPKCMADVRGVSLLQRLVSTLTESGARDVTVVRGYRKEAVAAKGVRMVDNDRYGETGEVYSLALALGEDDGETVIAYGDVLFRRYILDSLMSSRADIVLAVDAMNLLRTAAATPRDIVIADRGFSGDYLDDQPARLLSMAHAADRTDAHGEWMGLARFSARGVATGGDRGDASRRRDRDRRHADALHASRRQASGADQVFHRPLDEREHPDRPRRGAELHLRCRT